MATTPRAGKERRLILQVIQPGLLGLAVSMGLAEALSDDGAISGRGSPIIRRVSARPGAGQNCSRLR